MRTTIEVKKIYTKEGLTKKGKPYTLTKLLAGGKYYSTFQPVPNTIMEGSHVELEYDPTDTPTKCDITRIISISSPLPTDANPKLRPGAANTSTASALQPPTLQSEGIEEADNYVRDLYERAEAIAHEKHPEWEGVSEYPYLLAVLIQTMHGKLSGDRIAKQEEAKLKAYGGKRF